MRTLARTAILATLLLFVTSASAQRIATIGKEVPDVKLRWERGGQNNDEEFYLFRHLRGSIAVFYFWRSSNLDSVERLSEMEALHRKYGRQGVLFNFVTVDNEEKVEEVMEEKNVDFFRFRFRNSPGGYYLLGALSDPYVALVDPRGILAWRGVPDDDFEQRLADLIERTKPPAGDEQWLDRRFRKAERLHDQGEFGKACTIARELFKMTDDSHAVHSRAEALVARSEEGAAVWLREAIQAKNDKDLEEAARIVAEIAVRFHDPDEDETDDRRGGNRDRDDEENINRRAELEIGIMSGDRKLKKLIREARENAEGELRNDRAMGLEEDDYYVLAKRIYESVVKDYEDTKAGKEAKRRLRRILRDRTIRKKMAERRARDEAVRWLHIGEGFAAMELYDEAREHFERLIAEHPDTVAAQRAKERLADLPKPKTATKSADSGEAKTARKP
jgi:tetratricopeptide (TPR) repeat protein